jgi:hypothetical protein
MTVWLWVESSFTWNELIFTFIHIRIFPKCIYADEKPKNHEWNLEKVCTYTHRYFFIYIIRLTPAWDDSLLNTTMQTPWNYVNNFIFINFSKYSQGHLSFLLLYMLASTLTSFCFSLKLETFTHIANVVWKPSYVRHNLRD